MKIIRSVQDSQGNVIQKQPAGGTGQQRCGKCQGICTAGRLPGGKLVMKCNGCGASYVGTPLDGPKPPRPGAVPKRVEKSPPRR